MNRSRAVRAATGPSGLVVTCLSVLTAGAWGSACSTTDDRPAAWDYISPAIFQPNCATSSCHSRAAAVAGLDFSDPDRGYTSLTGLWVWIVDPNGTAEGGCKAVSGTEVCQRPNRPMVTPYDPAQSRVVNMLRARAAPRMPPDRPLPEADIELVERWILNGASRTVNGPPAGDAGGDSAPTDAGIEGSDGPTEGTATNADIAGALNDAGVADADVGVGVAADSGTTADGPVTP